MDANKEAQEMKETPERFFKLLEAGSLAYSDVIEYAFVIFGITKHGKTTLSHHLVNNSIKAYINDRKQVHYKLDQAIGSLARIGGTMNSQTQIPNKFLTPIRINQHPLYVIDNPGQLDSFGINRVLSNAYFHYRVFSKVKNMKFILVFDSNTFTRNLKETNAIFKLFFQSFTNFQQISDKIIKSIAIIFTKVDRNSSLQDFKQQLQAYENTFNGTRAFNNMQMQFLSKLFEQCKKNQRIKLFKKADMKHEAGKCTFLEELQGKLQFFTREIDETSKSVSLFYKEKRIKMDNIRFSESKSVKNLTINDFSRDQMTKLFEELTSRAKKMFGVFFNFIEKLVEFLLFEYDKCENVGNSIEKTETLKLNRQSGLKKLVLELSKFRIQYDEDQRKQYGKNRQFIIEKYKQKLKSTEKVSTFFERLDLSLELFEFSTNYTDASKFATRKESEIQSCIQDIEKVFLSVSKMYSNSEQIEILAKFFYDIKNYMDQLIIFCMIILPDENEGSQKIIRFLMQKPLDGFLKCLDEFTKLSVDTSFSLVQRIAKELRISKDQVYELNTFILMKHYLIKNPTILVDNREYSEALLKNLSTAVLSEDQKIQVVILMFNTLNDHYKRFMHFKKIMDPKNKNTIISQQHFSPKDIKKMILSIIALLKQVKRVKDLLNYKTFEKYRNQTYQISTICWNYIVKLFTLLIECQNIKSKMERQKELQREYTISIDRISPIKSPKNVKSQSMNANDKNKSSQQFIIPQEDLQEIIIEILSSYSSMGLIEETFKKLINIHREEFDHVTLQNCALKINKKFDKSLSGHESQCMIMFNEEKKASASKIIDILLSFASILNKLFQRDRSLAQCHEAIKYVEYYPQKMEQIEDKISEIEIHNNFGGKWILGLMDQKKINEFEPSLTTKRHLTKFYQDCKREDIKLLECVQYEIFKSEG